MTHQSGFKIHEIPLTEHGGGGVISSFPYLTGIKFVIVFSNYLTMKKFLVLILLLPIIFSECKKTKTETPDCINSMIANHTGAIFLCDTGARIDEYIFQKEVVYVFEPGSCGADMQAAVYDSGCKLIGALGGIAGNNIINNVLFSTNAVFQKTIWNN
jgi:hypothetical protein